MKLATFNKVAMTTDRINIDRAPYISDNAKSVFIEFCKAASNKINTHLSIEIDKAYNNIGIDTKKLSHNDLREVIKSKGINLRTNGNEYLDERIEFQIYQNDTPVSDVFGYSISSGLQITFF